MRFIGHSGGMAAGENAFEKVVFMGYHHQHLARPGLQVIIDAMSNAIALNCHKFMVHILENHFSTAAADHFLNSYFFMLFFYVEDMNLCAEFFSQLYQRFE